MKTIFAATILTFAMILNALAVECPTGAPSCKVIILTPQEENALIGINGIFATAAQARFIDLSDAVQYFRNKLATAPTGEINKPVPLPTPKPDANGNSTEKK